MLRYLTAGESHGKYLVGILEGMVAGVIIEKERIKKALEARRHTSGRSSRMRLETEEFEIVSGLRNGKTTGAPIAVIIRNSDVKELEDFVPRPGHADLAGCLKYGFENIHMVAERASARETSVRVALGSLARAFLENFGIKFVSHTVAIAGIRVRNYDYSFEFIEQRRFSSPLHCIEPEAEKQMTTVIEDARKNGDSVGGETEVRAKGLPVGLGSHVHYDRRFEYRIGGALLSIPAVKGLEIGRVVFRGSENNDPITLRGKKVSRRTNRAGGIEGGISNGEELIIRLTVKPVPTLRKRMDSFDFRTLEPARTPELRTDVCVVPAAGVVAENVLALEIAGLFLEKFGGDSLQEVIRNFRSYLKNLKLK